MKRSLLVLLSSFLLTFSVLAEGDLIGAPDESCNCGPVQSNTEQVIEAIAKSDVVVPIDLYYKLIKLGTADLSISHVDGKILKVVIDGRISAFGINESEKIMLDIDHFIGGKGMNFYSNDNESPIISVNPVQVTEKGGSVNLEVKMKHGQQTIPVKFTQSAGTYTASTNGRPINKLKIYLGFDMTASMAQQEVVNGRVNSYKIQ